MRRAGLNRPLLIVVILLAAFGVIMIYSAGQTDVPSPARGAWIRQLIWLGIGVVAAASTFRLNVRIIEWAAPGIYALGLALLALTLLAAEPAPVPTTSVSARSASPRA